MEKKAYMIDYFYGVKNHEYTRYFADTIHTNFLTGYIEFIRCGKIILEINPKILEFVKEVKTEGKKVNCIEHYRFFAFC